MNGYQVLSKLLRVDSESREEALKLYRVHFPCSFSRGTQGEGAMSSGTLYFNPEYDFLHLSPEWRLKETMVEFLYHLKTIHDHRHIGLLNLAVELNDLTANDLYMFQPSDLSPLAKEAVVETLVQLREVFFISMVRAGRQKYGLMSGMDASHTFLNRSFPIMAMSPTFERLRRDPRPIAHDLKRVYTGMSDRRQMLDLWRRLLTIFHVSPLYIEYRFLLTFDPTILIDPISDRRSGRRWLRREDDRWRRNEDWPLLSGCKKAPVEDLDMVVRPVFGFWLFPLNALGPFSEKGLSDEGRYQPLREQLSNMTEHWPELALSDLS